ncbi:MAG: hypothetical protein V3V78_02045 [Candidatus Woesearchaeota archaeon]
MKKTLVSIIATALLAYGGCGGSSGSHGSSANYATEQQGDIEIKKKLEEYLSNNEIDWFELNYIYDIYDNGLGQFVEIPVDAAFFIGGKYYALWHIGDEGDLTYFKSLLNADGYDWIQINHCSLEEVATIMDYIKNNGWQQGEY